MFKLLQQDGRQNKQNVQTENTKIAEMVNEMNLLKTELKIMQKECKDCRKHVVFYKRVVLFLFVVVLMYLLK